MEFIEHLGVKLINIVQEARSFVIWVKGILCLSALLIYIMIYQMVAISCSLASIVFPDSANFDQQMWLLFLTFVIFDGNVENNYEQV